jgi:hypothetical protein
MHFVCEKKHGDFCHFRFGCRHVVQASRFAGSPTPVVDDLTSSDIVCRECLTPKVKEVLDRLSASFLACRDWSLHDDEDIDRNIQRYFDCHEHLRIEIGYCPLCLECLYENTGIDRRVT